MKNIETLLIVGIGAISTGVSLIQTDIVTGLTLVVVGMAVIYFRGKVKA